MDHRKRLKCCQGFYESRGACVRESWARRGTGGAEPPFLVLPCLRQAGLLLCPLGAPPPPHLALSLGTQLGFPGLMLADPVSPPSSCPSAVCPASVFLCLSLCVCGGGGVWGGAGGSCLYLSLSLPAPVSLSLTCCCSVSPVPASPHLNTPKPPDWGLLCLSLLASPLALPSLTDLDPSLCTASVSSCYPRTLSPFSQGASRISPEGAVGSRES